MSAIFGGERPQVAACELLLVRFLIRLGLRISPRLLVVLVVLVTAGAAVLVAAGVQAWGNDAAVALRDTPGFFDHHPEGLTNAMHLIFLLAIPAIVLGLLSLAEVLGMSRPEPAILRKEQAIWVSFRFRIRDIIISDQILPRSPFQLLAIIPLVLALGFPGLTTAERVCTALLLGIWLSLELLRLAIASRRLARQPRLVSGRTTVMALVSSVVVGTALGWVIVSVWPVLSWVGARQGATVVAATTALVSYPGLVWVVIGLASAIGIALLMPLLVGQRTFGRLRSTPQPRYGGLVARALPSLFPVTSPQAIFAAWRTPEVCTALLAISAILVVQPRLTGTSATSLAIISVTGFMAFAVMRLSPQGAAASLRRLRHHYEQGVSWPVSLTVLLGVVSVLKALPFAVATVLLAHSAALPLPTALALPVIVLGATLVADALVATAATDTLTERRLMILAFLQAAGCMPGWAIVNYHASLGWLYAFLLFGVFTWLYTRRLTIWRPRVRW